LLILVCSISCITLNEDRVFFCTILKVNSGDVRISCIEAQVLAEKQSSFKVIFITQVGHTPGLSNSKQGRIMTILGLQYDADATKSVPETYQKQLLHFFPENGIVS